MGQGLEPHLEHLAASQSYKRLQTTQSDIKERLAFIETSGGGGGGGFWCVQREHCVKCETSRSSQMLRPHESLRVSEEPRPQACGAPGGSANATPSYPRAEGSWPAFPVKESKILLHFVS